MKNEEEVQAYTESLNNCLASQLHYWNDGDTVQNFYDKITNATDNSLKKAHEATSKTNKKKNRIISPNTKALISRRQEIHKTKPKSRAMKNELKTPYKRINQTYKTHRTQIIGKCLHATGSTKKAYKELRTHKSWIEELKG